MGTSWGLTLRTLRHDQHKTLQDVSRDLHITPSLLGMYEREERMPPLKALIRLANYYQVSLDYIMGLPPKPPTLNDASWQLFELMHATLDQDDWDDMIALATSKCDRREKNAKKGRK